ncbi:MAG: NADH-quinone oxidoreductase subunit J [Gammaproteobacteria bacterium]
MFTQSFFFYAFATILVISALRVITARNPIHSALFLVLAFFTSAALWIMLEAEFLAIVLVLVYVGAVMVLFLFVVMMLDINLARLREGFIKYLPIGAIVAILMVVEMVVVLTRNFPASGGPVPVVHGASYSNTKALGSVMYTQYLYPFEIAAVILLVAIIAAIALTLRRRAGTRYQNPAQQVKVRKQERLRIVKMNSEK